MRNPQEISELINNLVKEKGTSIHKMLQECNVSTSAVDSMKKGSKPSAETLAIIATHLGVSVNYLLDINEPQNMNQVTITPPADKVAISVIGYGRKQETKLVSKEKYDKFKATLDMLCDED